MPRRISASEAKNRLGSVMEWVLKNGDEVIVESRGAPTVVIISVDQYEQMVNLREQARRVRALDSLRRLRQRLLARNSDLTPEQGDALADTFSRDLISDLEREGKVSFEA